MIVLEFVIERRYLHPQPIQGDDGSVGERFVRSPEGLVLRCARIAADGTELTARSGVRALTFGYDQNFNVVRGDMLDGLDRPINGPDDFASYTREYDASGNERLTTYSGADGKLVETARGYTKKHIGFDERANRRDVTYLDANGKPTLNSDGYAVLLGLYDSSSNLFREDFFGCRRQAGSKQVRLRPYAHDLWIMGQFAEGSLALAWTVHPQDKVN